jgi:membrane-associated phospholipid phosphatase
MAAAGVPEVQARDRIGTAGDALCVVLPAAAGGLGIGHHDLDGDFQFARSLALTLAVTYWLKFTIQEKRPNGGRYSFPSGHTSISFCSAEFIRGRYGWKWGAPAYAAAAFVGYSRVECKAHYVHDVIAGAALGMLSTRLFVKPYKGWCVRTVTAGGHWGVVLSCDF